MKKTCENCEFYSLKMKAEFGAKPKHFCNLDNIEIAPYQSEVCEDYKLKEDK